MKRLLGWMVIALVGLIAAACASAPPATPTLAEAEATPEASPLSVAASNQPTEDITLVGKTGRPQFLDSFAHW